MLNNSDQQPDSEKSPEQLMEDAKALRSLIEGYNNTISGAFITLDSQWRIIYLNDEAEKLFDSDRASLLGRPLEEMYPRTLGFMLSPRLIRELLEGKDHRIDKYSSFLHRWFKISAYASEAGIFVRLEDTTAEMLVKRLLWLNEVSVRQARDMIFWFKTGGHIIYANQAACNRLGYTKEELTKMKVTDVDQSYMADKWVIFVRDIRKAGSKTFESNLRARDGTVFPVEVTCNFLNYRDEEYLTAFIRDITARKESENALIEAKADAELYLDLMSHDINNMNQVAIGYLELGLDKMRNDGRIESKNIDMLEKPYDIINENSRLIENVKKIQRARTSYYEPGIMDMGKVLQEVKNRYANMPERDISIELAVDDECHVPANELVKEIFSNLVGNSIKHSSGPLTIKMKMDCVEDGDRNYCRVSVEDNGPGITDEMKEKLLQRLNSKDLRARIKGFGLYLIKQLLKDFKGKFWIEDRVPGDHTKGAKFVVMLPALKQ